MLPALAACLRRKQPVENPAQLLDLMYLGDWMSTYLALDNDVDPGPIDAIFALKNRLAAR